MKDARAAGRKAGYLKIRILWPFPEKVIDKICRRAKRIVVPEMNIGKIVREVERIVGGRAEVVSVPKLGGEMHTPSEIFEAIK